MSTNANPIEVKGVAGKMCLGLTNLFVKGPLRGLNFRNRACGQRFESNENYRADRVANVSDYRTLFSEFASFEGKTVLELGCSAGYLLDAFLKQESFIAIGADINKEVLNRAQASYGDRIEFVQTTPTSIPVASESVDIVYTIDTVEHLSQPSQAVH